MIRVVVAGGAGKMGREVCQAVDKDPDLELVGAVGRQAVGIDLERSLQENRPQVMVDFTNPASVIDNIRCALRNKVHVVVGTTGISDKNLREIESLTRERQAKAIIAPNFALGAVLLIKLSELT